jgi:preprotein translocase subunit SecY
MFQPTQISEDLKKGGGYIPGIRPGKPTADFLDFTMSRLTFAGAIFLTASTSCRVVSRFLASLPATAQFFGGTSLLILVGVVLDVMRQIETHLLQSHYDGFLKKGRIRGRFDRMAADRPRSLILPPSCGCGLASPSSHLLVALVSSSRSGK